jgi:hypothetical protein
MPLESRKIAPRNRSSKLPFKIVLKSHVPKIIAKIPKLFRKGEGN